MSEKFPYAHDLMHPQMIDGCEICDDRRVALKRLAEWSVDPNNGLREADWSDDPWGHWGGKAAKEKDPSP